MHILLVPDKFKGSLTAQEVIVALEKGISRTSPEIKTSSFVLSDGGDGFLDAVASYKDLEEVWVETVDPLGRTMRAPYVFHANTATAYIELSRASGLALLKPEERNVMKASTLGTGIQVKNALENGAKHIYLGLGGSATNDAGLGIAQALGYRFLDTHGKEVSPTGGTLGEIEEMDISKVPSSLQEVRFYAINDVNNPLFGAHGAAHVYGGQKGADAEQIEFLDAGLKKITALFSETTSTEYQHIPGAGAAGGSAFGLKACFDATFISGTTFLIHLAGITELLKKTDIDLIITGEGKIDRQTQDGKLIKGIVDLGKRYDIPVTAICGKLALDKIGVEHLGLDYVFALQDSRFSDAYCMTHAADLIAERTHDFLKGFEIN